MEQLEAEWATNRPSFRCNFWVITENPADYPGKFVAQKWWNGTPRQDRRVADTLPGVRAQLPLGKECLPCLPFNDPSIIEVWI